MSTTRIPYKPNRVVWFFWPPTVVMISFIVFVVVFLITKDMIFGFIGGIIALTISGRVISRNRDGYLVHKLYSAGIIWHPIMGRVITDPAKKKFYS